VQQWTHYEICISVEQCHCEGDMLNKVITTNELWARAFELELK